MKVHHVSAIVATLAVACSSASTSESDASVVDSGLSDASQEASGEDAGTTPGDCVPVMNANPLQSDIESLAHALNLWTWSAEVRGAKETKVDECDSTIAYRIGPILAQGTLTEYARCALIKGSVIEVTGGTLNRPSSCTLFACGPKLGMTWSTGSGSVFQLRADLLRSKARRGSFLDGSWRKQQRVPNGGAPGRQRSACLQLKERCNPRQ